MYLKKISALEEQKRYKKRSHPLNEMTPENVCCDHDWSRTSTSGGHYPLKVARLPIPPRGQGAAFLKAGAKLQTSGKPCKLFFNSAECIADAVEEALVIFAGGGLKIGHVAQAFQELLFLLVEFFGRPYVDMD